jgi:hypothetical protein
MQVLRSLRSSLSSPYLPAIAILAKQDQAIVKYEKRGVFPFRCVTDFAEAGPDTLAFHLLLNPLLLKGFRLPPCHFPYIFDRKIYGMTQWGKPCNNRSDSCNEDIPVKEDMFPIDIESTK